MTTVNTSLSGLANIFAGVIQGMHQRQAAAMEKSAQLVEAEAKRVLGTYDYGWPQLSPYTLARKTTGNSPGLETGGMGDSVQHQSSADEFEVGSNEDKALWFEMGTSRGQPPRPFLTGAMTHKMPEILHELGGIISFTGAHPSVTGYP